MSREAGFVIADLDVGILDDPKMRRLARSTKSEAIIARCVAAYVSVVTASWGHGGRVSLEDAAPAWLGGLDDLRERLAAVELLDDSGRIPEGSWTNWFSPALTRREANRERWNRANAKRSADTAQSPRGDIDPRTVPSIPTGSVPSEARDEPLRNGTTDSTCPGCGDLVQQGDPNVGIVGRRGTGLGHMTCPERAVAAVEMAQAKRAVVKDLLALPVRAAST